MKNDNYHIFIDDETWLDALKAVVKKFVWRVRYNRLNKHVEKMMRKEKNNERINY